MRDASNARLERSVRAAILAGQATWHCSRCYRYARTRIGLALHILACREVLK